MGMKYWFFWTFALLVQASVIGQEASVKAKPLAVYSLNDLKVEAYDFKGLKHLLEKQSDTTYVVNFWATWCAPCVKELPHFEKLNADYASQKIKVLLVSLDFKKEIQSRLLPFIAKRKLKSQVVLLSDPDADKWINEVSTNWSGAIPATLIYNASLKKRIFYEKSFSYSELQNELKQFIP